MWNALDKEKSGKIPEKAAKLWGAESGSLKLVHQGTNLVFRLKSDGKIKFLRIIHPLYKSYKELLGVIDYQRYLFETGAQVCQPVLSKENNYIEEISHGDHTFLAQVNEGVQGKIMHFDHDDKKIYESWGKSLAHLHRAAKNYQPENTPFLYWHDLWDQAGRLITDEDKFIQEEYRAIDDWFGRLHKDQHNFGLIHGDHRSENVFYDGEQIHFIDFEEPVYHWFFADMARPFLELSRGNFPEWKEKVESFLDGYYTILPVEDENLHYLPWFIRMKNLELYLCMKNMPVREGFGKIRLDELRESIRHPLREWV